MSIGSIPVTDYMTNEKAIHTICYDIHTQNKFSVTKFPHFFCQSGYRIKVAEELSQTQTDTVD